MTYDFIHDQDIENNEDSDDDRVEFEKAEVEEIEDKIVAKFTKKQNHLSQRDLDKITQGLDPSKKVDISMSILESVMEPAEVLKMSQNNFNSQLSIGPHKNSASQKRKGGANTHHQYVDPTSYLNQLEQSQKSNILRPNMFQQSVLQSNRKS